MKRISEWEKFIKHYETESRKLSEDEKQTVLNFFKSREPDSAAASYTVDEITGKSTGIPLCAYEYEDFYWDSRDILYFEKYDMPLRSEFLNIVLAL